MINLLPSDRKEELKREETVRLISILGFLTFLFLICVVLLFLSIQIYLAGQIQIQDILLESKKQQLEKEIAFREQIQSANSASRNVLAFYTHQLKVSKILERLTSHIPEGIYLTSFNITPQPQAQPSSQKPNIKVSLTGVAHTRDILFVFIENLKGDQNFLNLYSPLTNWVKEKDINFALSFEISPP